MDKWMAGWMIDGWVGVWMMDGWMDERIDKWMVDGRLVYE